MRKSDPIVRRLVRTYGQASILGENGGTAWYRESQATAAAIARETGVSVEVAAGVIAALSPRMQWRANVRAATDACAGRSYGALGTSKRAAARIIAGEHPLDVLQGPKVRAFYSAIMGDEDAAVVDVWMLRAMGEDASKSPTRKRYAELADAIATAASIVGIGTATFQAIVWAHVRGAAV